MMMNQNVDLFLRVLQDIKKYYITILYNVFKEW